MSWTFFTNHAQVLFCLSENPDLRLREVADVVGITERAAQRIVAELEEAGYLSHSKVGRRNHYDIAWHAPLRHAIESHVQVGQLIEFLRPAIEESIAGEP